MNAILRLILPAVLIAGLVWPVLAQSQYPHQPIKLIVPYAPGGGAGELGTREQGNGSWELVDRVVHSPLFPKIPIPYSLIPVPVLPRPPLPGLLPLPVSQPRI